MWGFVITWRPSSVCLLTFHILIFSSETAGPNWTKLARKHVRSFIKFAHFVQIRQQTWPPWAILVSDWLIFKKSSPLKLLGQMKWYLKGSIYQRYFIKFPHFVPIRQQIWPLWAILVLHRTLWEFHYAKKDNSNFLQGILDFVKCL